MKTGNSRMDPLGRLIEDHEDVSEYLENLQEVLGFLHDEEAWSKLEPVQHFFERNVVDHFLFEETAVFPLILSECSTPEARPLLAKLQTEHKSILDALERFRKMAPDRSSLSNTGTQARIRNAGIEIIENLLAHASEEDDKLLPILKANRQIFQANADRQATQAAAARQG